MQPFTVLVKPAGADCNLNCRYCFYKDRAAEIGSGRERMTEQVLEKLVEDYLALGFEMAGFAWQGGEPTLMGLDFYKKAVELQKKYKQPGRQINNALQSNAVLLDEQWCRFLHDNDFLVGISIDGPEDLHNYYRLDHSGSGSFDKVVRTIEMCKEYKVQFNALILLNDKNVGHPDELFDFFTGRGIKFLQFIPCIEMERATGKVADFSITPQQYGEFLCRIFDRWCEYGPDKVSIRDFESILSYCAAGRGTICTFDKQCAGYIVVEHNGDCFPCDFFVEPKWRLGNIFETPIGKLAAGAKKRAFARTKRDICNDCLLCRYLDICRGGCTKDRLKGQDDGLSYFCKAYKRFFDYAMPRFSQIAASVSAGPAAEGRLFL